MQPQLPDGSLPGTRPYVAVGPPPGPQPGGPPNRPPSNLTALALAISLFLCFGYPFVIAGVALFWPDRHQAFDAMLWTLPLGAVLVLGSFILAIVALTGVRRSGGRTAMGVAAIILSLLAPVTSLAMFAFSTLLMSGGVHGRPLRRRDGKPVSAPDVAGDEWSRVAERPELDSLDAATRAALARTWLEDAALEHAAIAAFGKLGLDLLAMGAPPELVAGAHRAALEEVRHAEVAYAFASAYAGDERSPGALPEAAVSAAAEGPPARVARVVYESVVDGCVGEAAAAVAAGRVAARTVDPVVSAALARIAREESDHAALAEAVVAWCVARFPDDARSGLERGRSELAAVVARRRGNAGAEEEPLPGRASTREIESIRQEEASRVLAGLALPGGIGSYSRASASMSSKPGVSSAPL